MTLPSQFSWHHLNQWHPGWFPLIMMAAAATIYLFGTQRATKWPTSRSVCFALALVITFLATQSIIGVYDMALFSDHMIEHLLLIMVAAPLFALSAPIDLARAAGGARVQRILASKPIEILLHPLVGFGLYAAFIPATHLTSFFNVMLNHEWVHHSEQVAFLVVGYLFFRPAFGVEEGPNLNPGLRLVYVMAAVPVDTFSGLALAMETRNPFSAYRDMHYGTADSILGSVHLGGAIMWIGGDALMLLALIPIAVTWVKSETVRTRELDAQLDAAGL